MFSFLCKTRFLIPRNAVEDLGFIICSRRALSLSSAPSPQKRGEQDEVHSFTVSYLIDSCGLSPESALSASAKVTLKTPKTADSVLRLLQNYGLSKTHISEVIKERPQLLLSKPGKTLLPKLQFLCSVGVSATGLPKFMNSPLLYRSLEKSIIPHYNIVRTLLLTEEDLHSALCTNHWIPSQSYSKILLNIAYLQKLQMPKESMKMLLLHFIRTLNMEHSVFSDLVDDVKSMGFYKLNSAFVLALGFLSLKGRKQAWNRSCEVYRRWGWSEDDILQAFRRQPLCMGFSEEKIMNTMDFLVNKMGWSSRSIAQQPVILNYSLKKRIIPRCLVVKVLMLKGLKKDVSLGHILYPAEKKFLATFVAKYQEKIPKLINVYEGKMDVVEV